MNRRAMESDIVKSRTGSPRQPRGGERPAQRLGKLCRRGKRHEQKTRPYQQKQPEGHRDSRKPPRGCNIVDEQEADKEVGEGPFAQQTGNGDVPDGGHGRQQRSRHTQTPEGFPCRKAPRNRPRAARSSHGRPRRAVSLSHRCAWHARASPAPHLAPPARSAASARAAPASPFSDATEYIEAFSMSPVSHRTPIVTDAIPPPSARHR